MNTESKLMAILLVAVTLASGAGADVSVEQGVTYAYATVHAHSSPTTTNLLLDAYIPDPTNANGNALILVHGGSFEFGNRGVPAMVDAATYFSSRGWTCFSIDYRLTGDDPPAPFWIEALNSPLFNAIHAAMVDTKRAVRWVRAHGDQYGCTSNRVAGLGHSAGAYCVIQAGTTDEADFANDAGSADPDQWTNHLGKLNAVVEVSGGTLGDTSEFSPDDAPVMIWHGDDDQTVDSAFALAIREACNTNRIPVRFFALPGKDHGEETWTALYDGRDVKDHALEFLDLFFGLHIGLSAGGTGNAELSWPSISNAIYEVHATTNLLQPFHVAFPAAITAVDDTCSAPLALTNSSCYYRLHVLSGQ